MKRRDGEKPIEEVMRRAFEPGWAASHEGEILPPLTVPGLPAIRQHLFEDDRIFEEIEGILAYA
jgi:hypothetical protein